MHDCTTIITWLQIYTYICVHIQRERERERETTSYSNNIVITTHKARWVIDLLGRSLCKLNKCLITMLCTRN